MTDQPQAPKSKRDPHYINSNVVFVNQDSLIQEAVQEMIVKGISSIMVEDGTGHIVGIVTERDIVRKFTLLDVEDKLTRTVGTIMTRPVAFVQVKDFHKQIIKLHLERRIRHFPVLSAKEPLKENLVGIVSITDIARNYMTAELDKKTTSTGSVAPLKKALVGIMASSRTLVTTYIDIFNSLGFESQEVTDIPKFAGSADAASKTLIIDLDGFSDQKSHEMIPIAVKSKVFLVMTTSQPLLVPIFKRYFDREHQEISMKPIDISYLSWLLQSKWHVSQPK